MSKIHFSLKHIILFSSIFLFFIAISESILIIFTAHKNSEEVSVVMNSNTYSSPTNSIYLKISKYHSCYSQDNTIDCFYEYNLLNPSKRDFTNWKIKIEFTNAPVLKGFWNANLESQDNTILVTSNNSFSQVLKNGSSYSFEVYLNSLSPINYKQITITGNYVYKLSNSILHIINVVLFCIISISLLVFSMVYNSMQKEINILNRITKRSNVIIDQTMKTFVNFIDAKDEYTKGHSTRVAEYCRIIAKRMGYDEQFQQDIYYMGLMHDVGKITVPRSILNKTSHLTPEEWSIIQMHTENGANLLKNFTAVPELRDAVLYHHERYDGKGYLAHLKGEEIPLSARIICVADSFDAMNTNRCYRLKYSKERIIKEFERCSARQFDPTIASIMIELISDGSIK